MAVLGQIILSSWVFMGLSLLMFAPLERLMPARQNRGRAPWSDWMYFWVNPTIGAWGALTFIALLGATIRALLPAWVLHWTAGRPVAWQLFLAVLLAELWGYWAHRLAHAIPWLWRFHRVHHSIEEMRWISAHRQHPIDVIWLIAGANLPAFALGVNLRPLAAFIVFERCYTVFLHANLDCSYGLADHFLASPRFHHWHHDAGEVGLNRNFAGIFSVLDWIFGTYHPPLFPPEKFGDAAPMARGYINQIFATPPPAPTLKQGRANAQSSGETSSS